MTGRSEDAADMVARAMRAQAPSARCAFLRELLAHTAAGLVLLEGDRVTSEVVYRLADAVVGRGEP